MVDVRTIFTLGFLNKSPSALRGLNAVLVFSVIMYLPTRPETGPGDEVWWNGGLVAKQKESKPEPQL